MVFIYALRQYVGTTRIRASKEIPCPHTRHGFAAFGRGRGVNDGMRLSQTIRPGKRHSRNLIAFLSASVGGRTPSPRMIVDVREPPGVRTRRLPPHHLEHAMRTDLNVCAVRAAPADAIEPATAHALE